MIIQGRCVGSGIHGENRAGEQGTRTLTVSGMLYSLLKSNYGKCYNSIHLGGSIRISSRLVFAFSICLKYFIIKKNEQNTIKMFLYHFL